MNKVISNLVHLIKSTFGDPKKKAGNMVYSQRLPPEEVPFKNKFRKGDIWLDSSDSNRMYVWNGRRWEPVGGELVG